MSVIIEGENKDIFNFELSNKHGDKHFYEIYANNLQTAVRIAQKHFIPLYGSKATHLERNIVGFPVMKNI